MRVSYCRRLHYRSRFRGDRCCSLRLAPGLRYPPAAPYFLRSRAGSGRRCAQSSLPSITFMKKTAVGPRGSSAEDGTNSGTKTIEMRRPGGAMGRRYARRYRQRPAAREVEPTALDRQGHPTPVDSRLPVELKGSRAHLSVNNGTNGGDSGNTQYCLKY